MPPLNSPMHVRSYVRPKGTANRRGMEFTVFIGATPSNSNICRQSATIGFSLMFVRIRRLLRLGPEVADGRATSCHSGASTPSITMRNC